MNLLRFFTAGNVDDGKSTLIGRLLFDSESISTDIIETLTRQSKNKGKDTNLDLALLTDGLRAEREQGITIDVAYKYFSTEKRKFIIADTPGHIQYTRNMFTGASTADLAIILIDIVNGITEQTRRHSIISSILGIPNILVCINKMDLVAYSEHAYRQIVEEYKIFSKNLPMHQVDFIPVSALEGENIIIPSERMRWYSREPLLSFLENVDYGPTEKSEESRFQIQYVSNYVDTMTNTITRRFVGKILSGSYQTGDRVTILPDGISTKISALEKYGIKTHIGSKDEIVAIQFEDEIDAGRGNSIVQDNQKNGTSNELTATLCWMDNSPFHPGQKLILQHHSHTTKARITEILHKIDIKTNREVYDNSEEIGLNEICQVSIKTADPVLADHFLSAGRTGTFILIDENTNNTVAAGTVLKC
ncbi:MAG: GTP-binding protein [Saprospiraceae bacterium]|jgi:sulfate adenylyltransferase subunit 1|nr:GTP-binding protein [Saprospiraceae bacterium]